MRRSARPVVMLAVVGLVATFGIVSAQAAPAPCNLIKDVRGDANNFGLARAPVNDPAVDILSADIASDGSRITAVIRLEHVSAAKTDTQYTPWWSLYFEVGKVRYFMRAKPFRGKIVGESGVVQSGTGFERRLQTVSASLNEVRNELRITAPARDFAFTADLRPGTVLRSLQVQTLRVSEVGISSVQSPPRDQAAGTSYTAGSRSCVKVGS